METIEIKEYEETYPKSLLQIKEHPKKIYVKGDVNLLNRKAILAMVGSRNCSEYGRNVANSFSYELSKQNITIVSGLALGIDAASHIGAMKQKRKNNCCFRMWI
ncbi:MAG: hypothetical protein HFJ27_01105 [Clostridia bacterium]|nr:hypothetical protein [Clostridia bacterium]